MLPTTCILSRVATGQEMVKGKLLNAREYQFESGKIDVLKKSWGKLKLYNTDDLKVLKAGRNINKRH